MHPATRITPRVNLRLLQTFMIVAEHASFREAADQISRSQSAVSTQIRQLEDQLGVSLFNRTTRSVKLTEEGEALLSYASRALAEVETGLRHLSEAADVRRGRVTLACAPTIAATRLPPILAAYEGRHQGIRIVLHELKSIELFQRIRSGDVDFGIGPVVDDGDLTFEPILRERIHLFASPRFIPEDRPTIGFAELQGLPLIQFPLTTVMGQIMSAIAKTRGVSLSTRYECVQGQTLIALANAGLGAAVMTGTVIDSALGEEMRRPLVVDPEVTQDFAIVTMKGKTLSPAAKGLADIVRSMLPPIGKIE